MRQVLLAKPTGKRPRGHPRTRWNNYIYNLACSILVWSQHIYLKFLLTVRYFESSEGCCAPWPSLDKKRAWKWMNMVFDVADPHNFQQVDFSNVSLIIGIHAFLSDISLLKRMVCCNRWFQKVKMLSGQVQKCFDALLEHIFYWSLQDHFYQRRLPYHCLSANKSIQVKVDHSFDPQLC